MLSKDSLRQKAVILRKQGYTYSEILKQVQISKSTLSGWMSTVILSEQEENKIKLKKINAALKGGQARRKQRLELLKTIKEKAQTEIEQVSQRELWFMGVMLYWAEGSKEKLYRQGSDVIFSNSDPFMNKLFLKWLETCLKIPQDQISLAIYIHENEEKRIDAVVDFWQSVIGYNREKFDKIYYKKHTLQSNRRNKGDQYYGLLRVRVKKSTNINRKIAGWIEGIIKNVLGSGVMVTHLSLEQMTLGSSPSSPAIETKEIELHKNLRHSRGC